MKKILLVFVVAAITMVSCKKEEGIKPVKAEKVMAGGKTNMGGWD